MKNTFLILFAFSMLFFSVDSYAQRNGERYMTSYPVKTMRGSLIFRTNAITWAALVPSAGLEYKVSDQTGLLLDATYSRWKLSGGTKYWYFWNLAPEIRFYNRRHRGLYWGAQYSTGVYTINETQARYKGGGLTMGYQLNMRKRLIIEFGLGLGYLNLYDRENFTTVSDIDFRTEYLEDKSYYGLTDISVTLTWKLNKYRR